MPVSTGNFPYLVGQTGAPIYGVSGMPPMSGNYFWVDETNGSDGNTGGPQDPFATLTQAHSTCVDGNNDVVFLTGTIHQTATLAWSKNNTHLVGLCSPVRRGKRARISVKGTTAFTPLVSVTASGCIFRNLGTFYGFDSASNNAVCWSAAGQRCHHDNVEFLGFGDGTATTGTSNKTGSRAIVVGQAGGGGENTFDRCVFGADTEARGATNYTLEFLSGSGTPRNYFHDCDFEALLSAGGAAACHLFTAASSSIDRYQMFEQCRFHNAVNSTGTTMTALALLAASSGGYIMLQRCTAAGITDIEATAATNQIFIDGGPPVTTTTGLAVRNVT